MPREFYPFEVLRESRRVYDGIREWAAENPATLIGGWAVFEWVDERIHRQSRDVDVVLHTEEACRSFDRLLPDLNLVWDLDGKQKRMACHRGDDREKDILVDVFTPEPFTGFFRRHGSDNPAKPAAFGLFPPVEFLLGDKITTVPKRQGADATLKKAKDLVDIRDLVHFNRQGTLPRQLLLASTKRARELASFEVPRALEEAPDFKTELSEALDWLRQP